MRTATPLPCFNPCFNGRCKRTNLNTYNTGRTLVVSILVLMEDVKELATLLITDYNVFIVSILVLMEDVKEHWMHFIEII